jgi:hypothetical protein
MPNESTAAGGYACAGSMTPTLVGLENTAKTRECKMFQSPTACLDILRQGFAATTANDNGALNVWIDNDGKYRAEAQRYYSLLDSQIYSTQRQLKRWLKRWLKKIE